MCRVVVLGLGCGDWVGIARGRRCRGKEDGEDKVGWCWLVGWLGFDWEVGGGEIVDAGTRGLDLEGGWVGWRFLFGSWRGLGGGAVEDVCVLGGGGEEGRRAVGEGIFVEEDGGFGADGFGR